MNEQNLITRSTSEARELGRAGGIASGIARRGRKMLRERLLEFGLTKITDKETGKEYERETALAVTIANKAIKGDMKAARLYAELTGQLVQKIEVAPVAPNIIRVPEDDEQ